jgi:hypothetical protein
MKRWLAAIFAIFFAVKAGAFEIKDLTVFIQGADEITLYSLSPGELVEVDATGKRITGDKQTETFHGHRILGKLDGLDKDSLAIVRNAALDTVLKVRGPSYLCFDPRHGFRFKKQGQFVDLIVCFECRNGYCYWKDGEISLIVGSDAKDALNRLLDSHGIVRDLPPK